MRAKEPAEASQIAVGERAARGERSPASRWEQSKQEQQQQQARASMRNLPPAATLLLLLSLLAGHLGAHLRLGERAAAAAASGPGAGFRGPQQRGAAGAADEAEAEAASQRRLFARSLARQLSAEPEAHKFQNGTGGGGGCQAAGLLDSPDPEQGGQWAGYTQARPSEFAKPTFYTLRLTLDPTRRKFTGQLMIALDILAPEGQPSGSSSGGGGGGDQGAAPGVAGQLGHRYLTMHAGAGVQIKKAFYVFTARGSLQIPASKIGRDQSRELLTLDFHPNVISSGQGLLLIVYSAFVNETDSHGLFLHHSQRAKLRAPPGGGPAQAPTAGLATHMQPNFARRLFPSWDEPHLKARFNLIVVLPFRGYVTISNMPVKRKSISLSCSGEPLQEIEFHTTPTMSTYLLALVVGRFDHIELITPNNCKLRAYVYSNQTSVGQSAEGELGEQQQQQQSAGGGQVNHKKQAAQMALDAAVKTFDRLESLLGVRYPLAKFDMVAIRDFNHGGMENWGASIFNENYLLYDNQSQSQADFQVNGGRTRPRRLLVPLVVAHEIVHQWFGNLLTSRSWTYLWLNEGFAQLLMYELADHLLPAELYWHIFLEDSRASALSQDELLTSSHALELAEPAAAASGAPSNPQAPNWFDQLTYNKGAMVVRMVCSLLGRGHFFAGLRHYLLKHSYESVSSHDLWLALEESTGLADRQLESLMSAWLKLEGFPLVSVETRENSSHYKLRLSQQRFSLLPLAGQQQALASNSSYWQIPIAISSELNPKPSELQLMGEFVRKKEEEASLVEEASNSSVQLYLLSEEAAQLTLPKSQVGSWFKLNFNATGYFRVEYALTGVDMLARMVEPLRQRSMCVIDRFNLVEDLFAMVRAGRKPTVYYLRYLSEAFIEERELIVLRSIIESLKRIRAIVSNLGPKVSGRFDGYVRNYLRELGQRLNEAQAREEGGERLQWPLPPAQRGQNNGAARESFELVEATRLQFGDAQLARKAADLFNRNLRQQGAARATLEWMGRESRVSLYSASLAQLAEFDLAPDLSLEELWPGRGQQQQQQQAPADPILAAHSSLSSSFEQNSSAPQEAARTGGGGGGPQERWPQTPEADLFLKLLRAYETSEWAGERAAIASALGGVGQPNKRLMLLNLTLAETPLFRPQDSASLLESMGRSASGRRLIWELALGSQAAPSKPLERRQLVLLPALLRSLSSGLVEEPGGHIERRLRSLYTAHSATYGEQISEAIELLLVNSRWLQRDRQQLAAFLETGGQLQDARK